MLCVEFKAVTQGACSWCRKEKEVYSVSFTDKSFVGNLCKNDLLRAIGMKLGSANQEAKHAEAVPVNGPAMKVS